MIRHIVMFNLREGFSEEEQRANARQAKTMLEGLRGVIPGILEFTIRIDALPTSNRQVVINSLFESEQALAAYQVHPEHLRVGDFVASVMRDRTCIDYREEGQTA